MWTGFQMYANKCEKNIKCFEIGKHICETTNVHKYFWQNWRQVYGLTFYPEALVRLMSCFCWWYLSRDIRKSDIHEHEHSALLRQWIAVNLMLALLKHIEIANNAKNIMLLFFFLRLFEYFSAKMCSHLWFVVDSNIYIYLYKNTENCHVIYSSLAWFIQQCSFYILRL